MMDLLTKIPFHFVLLGTVFYLGYQFYDFEMGEQGVRVLHKAEVANRMAQIEQMKTKYKEAEMFLSQVEAKREDLLRQVDQLNSLQVVLSEGLEVPNIIKLLVTEAKNSAVKVEKIEPGAKADKEFFIEQEFKLVVQGTYVQIVTFLERISQLKRILRVEGYEISPRNQSSSRFILSEGKLSVRAYQYSKSQADNLYNELKAKKEALRK